jgi:hypothetical protein
LCHEKHTSESVYEKILGWRTPKGAPVEEPKELRIIHSGHSHRTR